MDNYQTVISNANDQFKFNYVKALIISGITVVSVILNIILIDLFDGDTSIAFGIASFLVSTVTSYLIIHFAIKIVQDDIMSIGDVFQPLTKVLNFAIYSLAILVINYVFVEKVGSISIDLLFIIFEPFGGFLMNASSTFGLIVRMIIVLDFMLIPIFLVTVLVFHKFIMIPFYILEGENIIDAFVNSWNRTTGYLTSIIKILGNVFIKFMIFFNVFLLISLIFYLNSTSLDFPAFFEYLLYGVMLLFFIPYYYVVIATLFDDLA